MTLAQPHSATASRPLRLERLEVLRYGKFTDLALEFPARGLDFHLIVGANEAGKSTVRAAISDLLFGIETRTPYAFVHDYDALRLGGVIARGGQREHFQRLKRTKNPLRDASGQPLRDDLLFPYLGEMDRLSYERMFCLDHERLVQGGDEILTSRDDLAGLLFQASSGITGFGPLRDALEQEASALWAKRRSGDRAFYRAADELQEAERELKATTIRARDWAEVEKRVQASREALGAARRSSEALEIRRTRLERVRRVAPQLQKLRAALEAHAPLAGVTRLPRSARAELERAEREIADATVRLAQAERARIEAEQRIGGIVIEGACLERALEIRALADERVRTGPFARDLEKRRAELALKRAELRRLAGELGWQGEEAALARMIPPQTARAAIQEQLQEHGRLGEAEARAAQALAERRQELAALDAQLEALVVPVVPPALRTALAHAQALGNHAQRLAETRADVELERGRSERALQQLRPWQGSPAQLRALALPLESEAREQQAQEQELDARLQTRREELARAARELAESEARAKHLASSKRLVTREALEEARRERDRLWQRIRERALPLEAGAEALDGALAHTDRLADERYAGASDLARLEHLEELLAGLRSQVAEQERLVATLAAQLAALQAGWQERLCALGLEGLTTAQFLEWSRLRNAWLAHFESLATQEAELARLLAAGQSAADALRAAFAACGAEIAPGLDFESLVGQAAELIRSAETLEARRAAVLAQRQSAGAVLATLERRAEQARAQLEQWQERWRERILAARLPADTGQLAASHALELFASLAAVLKEAQELREQRIEAMQGELDAFAQRARQLAADLAPELTAEPPERIALELEARLAEAQQRAQRLEAARTELERAQADIEQASQERERAEASLQPLMERAGTRQAEELRAAIERSEQLLELEETIGSLRASCLGEGDGLALEALEAEVDGEDLATLAAQLAQLDAERARTVESREALVQAVTADEAELRRYGGQEHAALAEAKRQEALASMADAIERYVKVRVAARLLSWCIDRYREEKQGPLLVRASEIFSILTRGSFERLMVDFDGKSPQLKGCRAGGKLVDVSGMSDGTRDQLYLALRLAALELQLDHGRALPFVADDLFINFDDERSAAGFQALAELAGQTQVIFLTHHEHLVPIVERAIGPPLNVVRLG